ncbi:MAG: hypothetical protein JKY56_07155 [Kofleriaceae bacterium]|nr:hypothetical protein [Kofleriaceae bacterium]
MDFDQKEARVEFDAKIATIDQMAAALDQIGFQGSLKSWPEG